MARPENRSEARALSLTLPLETFNYLALLATLGKLGRTENEVATHILVREAYAMLERGFHEEKIPPAVWHLQETRIVSNMERILGLFRSHEAKATFFVLGWVADHFPEVVKMIAAEGHELDRPALARLEADGGAGGNVQTEAVGRGAVELERGVGLEEMVVRADLNRSVAGVGDRHADRRAADVQRDLAIGGKNLSRPHWIGSWTVTSFVPSGKVASTWTSWIISATPSMTSSTPRMVRP